MAYQRCFRHHGPRQRTRFVKTPVVPYRLRMVCITVRHDGLSLFDRREIGRCQSGPQGFACTPHRIESQYDKAVMTLPELLPSIFKKIAQKLRKIAVIFKQSLDFRDLTSLFRGHIQQTLSKHRSNLHEERLHLQYLHMGRITHDASRQRIGGVRPLPCQMGDGTGTEGGSVMGRQNRSVPSVCKAGYGGKKCQIEPFEMVLDDLQRKGQGADRFGLG